MHKRRGNWLLFGTLIFASIVWESRDAHAAGWWLATAVAVSVFCWRLPFPLASLACASAAMACRGVTFAAGLSPGPRALVEAQIGLQLLISLGLVGVTLWVGQRAFQRPNFHKAWAAVLVTASALTLGRVALGMEPQGALANPSMNGCLIACLLPMRTHRWQVLLGIAAVLATRASIPFMVMAVVLWSWLWVALRAPRLKALMLIGTPGVVLAVLGLGHTIVPEFTSLNGREEAYRILLRLQDNPWLGQGMGTVKVALLAAQEAGRQYAFINAHSDWLELYFEGGWVAVGFWGLCLAMVAWRSYKMRLVKVFAPLAGLSATALFNYPSHVAVFPLLGATLLGAYIACEDLETLKTSNGST